MPSEVERTVSVACDPYLLSIAIFCDHYDVMLLLRHCLCSGTVVFADLDLGRELVRELECDLGPAGFSTPGVAAIAGRNVL